MIKRLIKILIIILLVNLCLGSSFTKYDLPIQEEGRTKPFSTYSTNQLLKIYNKRSYTDDSISKSMKVCSKVIHLAALIGIPYSYVSPLAYIRTNIEGTYNVIVSAPTDSMLIAVS